MSLASPGMSLNSPGMSLPSPALTSPCPSGMLQSPASLASPAVSLPSLQSPLTPCLDDKHALSSVGSSASSSHNAKGQSNSHNSALNIFNNSCNQNSSSTTPSSSSSTSPPMSSLILGLHSTFHPNVNNSHHSKQHQNSSNPFGPFFGANGTFPGLAGLGLSFKSPHRSPVGANPHDINNPLSVNQLTNNNNNHHNHNHSTSNIKRSSGNSSSSSLTTKNTKNSSSSSTENGNSAAVIGVSWGRIWSDPPILKNEWNSRAQIEIKLSNYGHYLTTESLSLLLVRNLYFTAFFLKMRLGIIECRGGKSSSYSTIEYLGFHSLLWEYSQCLSLYSI